MPAQDRVSLTRGTLLKNRLAIKIIRLNYFHVWRVEILQAQLLQSRQSRERGEQRPLGVGARLERASYSNSEWVDDLSLLLHEHY